MNYALIFAGGVGQRMNTISLPKQFLKVHDKEIIIHTLEKFEDCSSIDGIVVVCIEEYIDYLRELISKHSLKKIIDIVPGGSSGQSSIFNGLTSLKRIIESDDIVLIHDGVRPLIDEQTILNNIECVKKNRTCVTVAQSTETVLVFNNANNGEVLERSKCYLGRAPQSFYFEDIYACHLKANEIKKGDFIDSAMMMQYFGYKIHKIDGPIYNIKITTPIDYFMFKAILDSKENEQIKVVDE